jgi:hypothetical protein
MPISGSVDFGALAVGDRPRRQAPRDLSPPPRPRKTPRFDPEVRRCVTSLLMYCSFLMLDTRRVSPPAHAVIHRRRALSPSPTIINLPDDAEPTLPPAFADSDDEDEGYVFVNRPRLDPPVRRYTTPALFGHPVAAPAVCKTARPVSPTTVNHASSITSSRRSSFAMSRPAFVPPSPDANSAKISSVDDAERRDFECLTSVCVQSDSCRIFITHRLLGSSISLSRFVASDSVKFVCPTRLWFFHHVSTACYTHTPSHPTGLQHRNIRLR